MWCELLYNSFIIKQVLNIKVIKVPFLSLRMLKFTEYMSE